MGRRETGRVPARGNGDLGGDKYPDFEMRVAVSRQAEIRFENWKPDKTQAEELRAEIGDEIALVIEGIEPENYLSE